jgi:hypothetical protein
LPIVCFSFDGVSECTMTKVWNRVDFVWFDFAVSMSSQ